MEINSLRECFDTISVLVALFLQSGGGTYIEFEMYAFIEELPSMRRDLGGRFERFAGLAKEAGERFGSLGRFSSAGVACLDSAAFLGGEMMILIDIESGYVPVGRALHRFGDVIRQMEETPPRARHDLTYRLEDAARPRRIFNPTATW